MDKRAVIYCRQSRDIEDTGQAVERQEEACRALARARGWSVVAVYVDNDVSASKGMRPQWARLLASVQTEQVDVIMAQSLDRITRTMQDLEQLITLAEMTGTVVITTNGELDLTTDAGRMVARILAAVARGEVDRKAARQVAAERQRVGQGRPRWSRRPFGYEKDGTLREPEAQLLRQAYADILTGTRLSAIVKQWNADGITTTVGKPWGTQVLGQLLRDPRNAGKIRYRGQVVGEGGWTPIVTEDIFDACVHTLRRGPNSKGGRTTPSDAWLISVARCGHCNGRVWIKRRDGDEYYTCKNGHMFLDRGFVEGAMLRHLAAAFGEHVEAYFQQGDPDALPALRAERDTLEARRNALAEAFADGAIDLGQLQAGTNKLQARLAEIDDELGRVSSAERIGPIDNVNDALRLMDYFEQMTPQQVRHWLLSVGAVIKLFGRNRRGGSERRELSPDLVSVELPAQQIYLQQT